VRHQPFDKQGEDLALEPPEYVVAIHERFPAEPNRLTIVQRNEPTNDPAA